MPSQQQLDPALEGWKMMPLLFELWDVDSSGTIDRYELTAGMLRLIKENGLDITISTVERIMREADLNGDDELDRREFGYFLSRIASATGINVDVVTSSLVRQKEKDAQLKVQSAAERAWADMPRLFRLWDFDENGYIDKEEVALGVRNFLRSNGDALTVKLTIAECLHLMDECDSNGDRVLDMREFGAFVARFALSTGIPMDEVVRSLMDACKKAAERRTSAAGKVGAFFARVMVGMAEEELIESTCPAVRATNGKLSASMEEDLIVPTRPRIKATRRTISARGA